MEINPSEVLATIINFIIFFLIMRHFLFNPVNKAIDSRQNEIVEKIKNTDVNQKKAEELRKENEQKLLNAGVEGKKIVEEYKVKAEQVSSDIVNTAKNEADLTTKRAKTEIEREMEKANEQVKLQAIDLAVLLSSKVLDTSIDDAQHRKLIQDFIAKVGM